MSRAPIVGPPPRRHRARSGGLTLVSVVALVAGITACSSPPPPDYATAPSGSVSIAPIPGEQPVACDPATAAPGETVTRSPGNYGSPTSVVADYHWSIITGRDAARAQRAVRADQPMGRSDLIVAALDGFPVGTTYCLRMRQTAPTVVELTLTARVPGGPEKSYPMRADVGGTPGDLKILGEVPQ